MHGHIDALVGLWPVYIPNSFLVTTFLFAYALFADSVMLPRRSGRAQLVHNLLNIGQHGIWHAFVQHFLRYYRRNLYSVNFYVVQSCKTYSNSRSSQK